MQKRTMENQLDTFEQLAHLLTKLKKLSQVARTKERLSSIRETAMLYWDKIETAQEVLVKVKNIPEEYADQYEKAAANMNSIRDFIFAHDKDLYISPTSNRTPKIATQNDCNLNKTQIIDEEAAGGSAGEGAGAFSVDPDTIQQEPLVGDDAALLMDLSGQNEYYADEVPPKQRDGNRDDDVEYEIQKKAKELSKPGDLAVAYTRLESFMRSATASDVSEARRQEGLKLMQQYNDSFTPKNDHRDTGARPKEAGSGLRRNSRPEIISIEKLPPVPLANRGFDDKQGTRDSSANRQPRGANRRGSGLPPVDPLENDNYRYPDEQSRDKQRSRRTTFNDNVNSRDSSDDRQNVPRKQQPQKGTSKRHDSFRNTDDCYDDVNQRNYQPGNRTRYSTFGNRNDYSDDGSCGDVPSKQQARQHTAMKPKTNFPTNEECYDDEDNGYVPRKQQARQQKPTKPSKQFQREAAPLHNDDDYYDNRHQKVKHSRYHYEEDDDNNGPVPLSQYSRQPERSSFRNNNGAHNYGSSRSQQTGRNHSNANYDYEDHVRRPRERDDYVNEEYIDNNHGSAPMPRNGYSSRDVSEERYRARRGASDVTMEQALVMLAENMQEQRSDKYRYKEPEYKSPMFDGDVKRYRVFKESFRRSIRYSRAQPMDHLAYLKSKVTGDALHSIELLPLTNRSYYTAWEILDKRYNNRRSILRHNFNALLDLKHPDTNSSQSLLKFIQSVQGFTTSLIQTKVTFEKVLVIVLLDKLDKEFIRRFEMTLDDTTLVPKFDDLMNFMDREFLVLPTDDDYRRGTKRSESSRPGEGPPKRQEDHTKGDKKHTRAHVAVEADSNGSPKPTSPPKCFICKQEHTVFECSQFLKSKEKEALMKENHVCIYCGKHKWSYKNPCRSRPYLKCEICTKDHATPMCTEKPAVTVPPKTIVANHVANGSSEVILPTAITTLVATNGTTTSVRCLLDSGSQSTFITEQLVQTLQLRKKKADVVIHGFGGLSSVPQAVVTISIQLANNEVIKTKALVVKRVTGQLPSFPSNIEWDEPDKQLADPHFNKPAHIPLLLGSNILPQIFKDGVELKNGMLYQNTALGWVVSGSPSSSGALSKISSCYVTLAELETAMINLWDLPINSNDVEDDSSDVCEAIFKEKHSRTADGRYKVPIPWRKDAPELGSSYLQAARFYIGQEFRWLKNPEHLQMSNDFMREYINLGHMSLVPKDKQQCETNEVFYIPYISILRKDALTTKLRNVFNASAPSSTGVSLNQQIHAGPKLQTHIFDIITQIRQYKYIFSADICKMFRQILLNDEDSARLRIVWRPNRESPLEEYQLNTITYGMDCAPWQSIRTLHQIADDNAPDEETKEAIKKGMYVDDLLGGGDTIEDCKRKIQNINNTLEAGKMPLLKWMSNHPATIEDIPAEKKITSLLDLSNPDAKTKLLGLMYNPTSDIFSFNAKPFASVKYTKRGLLSVAASLYDPIGWILPVIIAFRINIQSLWWKKYDWDDAIDEDSINKFKICLEDLEDLSTIRIPRWTGNTHQSDLELVGFSDASGDAFSAVIYSRVLFNGEYRITLMAAKGRVCPLKTKENIDTKLTTIPKLELESICLLADLLTTVTKSFPHLNIKITAYTDSEIALSWVRSQTQHEQKFIRRRAAMIRKVINANQIHHVRSEENPADPASRGLSPRKFLECNLWFNGPTWLKDEILPTTAMKYPEVVEVNVARQHDNIKEPMLTRFSSFQRMINVLSRCRQWATERKSPKTDHGGVIPALDFSKIRPLTAAELEETRNRIIKHHQHVTVRDELKAIESDKKLPKASWLNTLAPILDDEGILRVGGRIPGANLASNQSHPILLNRGHLVDLLIRHIHQQSSHGGNKLTERLIREEYWIPGASRRVKSIINQCPTCTRWRAKTYKPKMSDLPPVRIQQAPVWASSGVDLAGPFMIKASKTRFDKVIKVWIAIFVCLVTKAVHLEIVSDLSTEAFLAAFSRFCSRRSTPSLMMSDNGTNFVGAKRVLSETWQAICRDAANTTASQNVKWSFIPAMAPSFGGLWEAAVKSMKYFTKRMESLATLTYEDFTTTCCRIESLLNSRPLTANTGNPEDDPALTPFHFITQRHQKLSPTDIATLPAGPLSKRWLEVQKLQNHFWDRFRGEYLHTLQKRYNNQHPDRQIQLNDLVLIKEPSSTPGDWQMGRVIKLYPNIKNEVRRVDVRTAKKEFTHRATKNLVPLLPEEVERESAGEDILVTSTPPKVSDEEQAGTTTLDEQLQALDKEPAVTAMLDDPLQLSDEDAVVTTIPNIPPHPKTKRGRPRKTNVDPKPPPVTAPDNEETAGPRRSKRLQKPTLANALLLLLAANSAVNGLIIEPLTPGTHVRKLGAAAVLAYELDFAVQTTLNITSSKLTINQELDKFKYFCATYNNTSYERLNNHCHNLVQHLESEALLTKKAIGAGYTRHRSRRSWISLAIKATPIILTSVGCAYQTYETELVKAEVSRNQEKTAKLASLMLKLNDGETKSIDANLDQMINQQREIALREEISEYGSSLQTIFQHILNQHVTITDITPNDDLASYIASVNMDTLQYRIPSTDNPAEVFQYKKPTKSIKDGLVVVEFKIPILYAEPYEEFIIISAPANGLGILFDQDKPFLRVALNAPRTIQFTKKMFNEANSSVYDKNDFQPLSSCIHELLKTNYTSKTPASCTSTSTPANFDKFFPVGKGLVVAIKSTNSTLQVLCSHSTKVVSAQTSVITLDNCTLTNGLINVTTTHHWDISEDLHNPTDSTHNHTPISDIIKHPAIEQLRSQLLNEINETKDTHTNLLYGVLASATTIIILFTIIAGWIIYQRRTTNRANTKSQWFLKWTPQLAE